MAAHNLARRQSHHDLLTVREAAALYHVHPESVWRWVREGLIPAVRVGPFRRVRLRRVVLSRFFDGGADT
jgi:excisionase family DNA binding protein